MGYHVYYLIQAWGVFCLVHRLAYKVVLVNLIKTKLKESSVRNTHKDSINCFIFTVLLFLIMLQTMTSRLYWYTIYILSVCVNVWTVRSQKTEWISLGQQGFRILQGIESETNRLRSWLNAQTYCTYRKAVVLSHGHWYYIYSFGIAKAGPTQPLSTACTSHVNPLRYT